MSDVTDDFLVTLLSRESTVAAAGRAVGLSARSVYRRLRKPGMADRLRAARAAYLRQRAGRALSDGPSTEPDSVTPPAGQTEPSPVGSTSPVLPAPGFEE